MLHRRRRRHHLLLLLLLLLLLVVQQHPVVVANTIGRRKTVYISEFSYRPESGDFVEFVGPKNWSLVNTFLSFYRASSNVSTGVLVDTASLSRSVVQEFAWGELQSMYVYRSRDLVEDGVGALALSVVVQGVATTLHYVSYGGTFATTRGGLADGLVPTDVGVVEEDRGAPHLVSVQLDPETETWSVRCATAGRANPGTLASRAPPLDLGVSSAKPWINELHYTDATGGSHVFVEVAGPEEMPVAGYVLSIYQAPLGGTATLVQCREVEDSRLERNVVNHIAFLHVSDWDIPHSSDKVTAIALSANLNPGNLYDYVSWNGIGGSAPASTLHGPAAGFLPTDTLVQESNPETPVGTSLQRIDVPLCLTDDAATAIWTVGMPDTRGFVNAGQEDNTNCPLPLNPWRGTEPPTGPPTLQPTTRPPTTLPTVRPSTLPTFLPSSQPTTLPTVRPTAAPTTSQPTIAPTTDMPTVFATRAPTRNPSAFPTSLPTWQPSAQPSSPPTPSPTLLPSLVPLALPVAAPTAAPSTVAPSLVPSSVPSPAPSTRPTTTMPTASPTPCVDDATFFFLDLNDGRHIRTCAWIGEKVARQETFCRLPNFAAVGPLTVRQYCPQSCGLCPRNRNDGGATPPLTQQGVLVACPAVSTDDAEFRIVMTDGREKPCRFLKKQRRIRQYCKQRRVRRHCPFSCQGCTQANRQT